MSDYPAWGQFLFLSPAYFTTLLDILRNTDCADTAHTTAQIDMRRSKVGGVGGVGTAGVPIHIKCPVVCYFTTKQ